MEKIKVIVFDADEWAKVGDSFFDNSEFYKEATLIRERISRYEGGEPLVDVIFPDGRESNGHLKSCVKFLSEPQVPQGQTHKILIPYILNGNRSVGKGCNFEEYILSRDFEEISLKIEEYSTQQLLSANARIEELDKELKTMKGAFYDRVEIITRQLAEKIELAKRIEELEAIEKGLREHIGILNDRLQDAVKGYDELSNLLKK